MMDDWPDDPEIGTWRQVYRNLQRTGSPACPSDDRLIALLLHDSDHAARELLTDHIVRCQRCTDVYQTLLRVQSDRSTTLQDAASGAAAILGVGMPTSGGSDDGEPLQPPHHAHLPKAPSAMVWPAVADAVTYRLSLFDAASQLLWQSDVVHTTRVHVPAHAQSRLRPGQQYSWSVEVHGKGTTLPLGPFRFTLASALLDSA